MLNFSEIRNVRYRCHHTTFATNIYCTQKYVIFEIFYLKKFEKFSADVWSLANSSKER